MDVFKSAVIGIFALLISFLSSILSMLYGWGIEPKSWGWILSMYAVMIGSSLIARIVVRGDKDK